MSTTLTQTAPGAGHNNPPPPTLAHYGPLLSTAAVRAHLNAEYKSQAERVAELVQGVENYAGLFPTGLQTAEDAAATRDFVAQLRLEAKAIEATRKRLKEPFFETGKAIDAFLGKGCAEKLDARAKLIEATYLTAWDKKVAAEAQARLDEAARLAREEAEALAALAEASNVEVAVDEAIAASAHADRAERRTEASVADLSRGRGLSGAVGSLRRTVTITITDPLLVPREYLVVDEAAVRAALTRKDNPVESIPGVTVTTDFVSRVRA